jgi:hypothetical protein
MAVSGVCSAATAPTLNPIIAAIARALTLKADVKLLNSERVVSNLLDDTSSRLNSNESLRLLIALNLLDMMV